MFETLLFTSWVCFALYTIWYLTSAKHYAPLTVDEAKMLWKIHKQNISCDSRMWREIRRGGKIVGFACECGYNYTQKRPIVTNTPAPDIHPQESIFDKLHTTHKST